MIQINCTKCNALLTLDDGFAGGTCRCRHCNAIQTVPRHLRDGNGNGMMAVGAKTQKLIYENQSQSQGGPGSGSGIDELANIVASSGLSSKRLQKASTTRTLPPTANKSTVLLLSIAGTTIAVLLGVIIVMAVRDKTTPLATNNNNGKPSQINPDPVRPNPQSNNANTNNTVVTPTPPKTTGPAFLGLSLNYGSIIYVIDCGQSASQYFNSIKAATVNSIESLGPSKKFQVVMWDNGQILSYPANGLANATPREIAEARKFLADVAPYKQSHADPAVKRAAASNPDAICLLAAKLDLSDDFSDKVIKALGKSKAKVHTFVIGNTDISTEMKQVSSKTGGQHRDITTAQLNAAAR